MKSIEQKYAEDELRVEELKSLRERVNAMGDADIEQMMRDGWMDDDVDESVADDKRMRLLKNNIDRQLGFKSGLYLLLARTGRIAAAVLIPVLILSTFYFYRESKTLQEETMLVSTGEGERANITLPDGSYVALNSSSRLSYVPAVYNKKERQIQFEGEGFFQVSKNKDCPFLIGAKGMTVKVLGTTFNLQVRNGKDKAELTLEEGSVLLVSVRTGGSVVLKPDQKAVLNQADGKITVVKEELARQASAWKHGDMVFKNTPLADVLGTIQDNYGIEMRVVCKEVPSDSFTGTIPTSDLNEVLDILEKTYHLKAVVKGKIVYMDKEE